LKESDDQGIADLGVGALHGRAFAHGKATTDPQRTSFEMAFNEKISVGGELTDDPCPRSEARLGAWHGNGK
jgi:hypothetical protein